MPIQHEQAKRRTRTVLICVGTYRMDECYLNSGALPSQRPLLHISDSSPQTIGRRAATLRSCENIGVGVRRKLSRHVSHLGIIVVLRFRMPDTPCDHNVHNRVR